MPKIPRGKDFVKFLLKIGYYVDRQNGSHVILKNGNLTIVVPVHGGEQLRIGFFKKTLKDMNLTDEEFWQKF